MNELAQILSQNLATIGYKLLRPFYPWCHFFDTVALDFRDYEPSEEVIEFFLKRDINLRQIEDGIVSISLDETTTMEDVSKLIIIFSHFRWDNSIKVKEMFSFRNYKYHPFKENLIRKSTFMNQQIFNSIHSETQMLRFIRNISKKDISLAKSMIPLGSCTMKLNSSSEMVRLIPVFLLFTLF